MELADQIQELSIQVWAMGRLAFCWFQLDHWEEVLEINANLRELVQRYTNFFERAAPPCFQIGLAASVYAMRGEYEKAVELRGESNAIMLKHDGSSDHWTLSNYI